MEVRQIKIENIPAVIWGGGRDKVFIAVHGVQSNKQDEVIRLLSEQAVSKGYSVISFDLPEHGQRQCEQNTCKVQNCVSDLSKVMDYAKQRYEKISLFGCSLGAYVCLNACKGEQIQQAVFLSPIVDMLQLVNGMLAYNKLSVGRLAEEKIIRTDSGQTLYWEDYCYITKNAIDNWSIKTDILYTGNDNLQSFKDISLFCDKFNCNLNFYVEGEHYFHTPEQLSYYERWLKSVII